MTRSYRYFYATYLKFSVYSLLHVGFAWKLDFSEAGSSRLLAALMRELTGDSLDRS